MRLDEVNREKTWECQGYPELRPFHNVNGYYMKDGHCNAVRESTCFCHHYENGNWRQCPNKAYIHNWVYHTLVDKEATKVEPENTHKEFKY